MHCQIFMCLVFSFVAFWGQTRAFAYHEVAINSSPNHAVNYRVIVDGENPGLARVQMEIRGADEVLRTLFYLDKGRYRFFQGDGDIKPIGTDILWTPHKLNAKLSYQANLRHQRKPGYYDSYGEKDWFITRTSDLFPRKRFDFKRASKSYTTVEFDLPKGWSVVSEMPSLGKNKFRAIDSPETRYQWPTGWLLFGRVGVENVKVGDVTIRLAYPEDFLRYGKPKYPEKRRTRIARFQKKLTDAREVYSRVVPLMQKFLPGYSREFLVVFGKSPMWRGGLSGERSLFINRSTPIIVSDFSSTLVHEYFHLCDGFKKDPVDAEWFVEGLAEYFSLRLLKVAKLITREEFYQGIEFYHQGGQWNHNLLRTKNERIFYENAPLVLFVLDEMIREKHRQKKSLKDVMMRLANEDEPVGTKLFQKHVEAVYGEDLSGFFKNHVVEGRLPPYKKFMR